MQNQRVFEKNGQISTTLCVKKENSPQPKHLEKAARKVQVSANRNLSNDNLACFVTT